MSHTPRGPVNDWLWRSVKAGGSVTIPASIYVAQRIAQRHEFEVEGYEEDEGDGVVTLIAHREYRSALEGHDEVDSRCAAVPSVDAGGGAVCGVSGDADQADVLDGD